MSEQPDFRIVLFRGVLHVSFWRDGKRRRLSLDTTDQGEAAKRAPAVIAEALRPQGKTVAELWEGYQADMVGRAVIPTMRHNWKAMRERFGALPGDCITVEDCRAHIAERRAAGIKDGTIHTELGHLRMILLWAVKQRLLKEAPHIERPAKPKSRTKHLTAFQVRQLADACHAPHLTLFVHLAFATAGRAGAILGLTWDRVDFERNKIDLEDPDITVPHKGRAVVPMTKAVRTRLLAAREGALSPYVIEWAGERVGSVKKGLARAAKDAGLQHVSPHMLRHSAAVRQAEMGVPMEEIASHLGHSDTKITRAIYARFSPEALSRSAAALELDDGPQEVRRVG